MEEEGRKFLEQNEPICLLTVPKFNTPLNWDKVSKLMNGNVGETRKRWEEIIAFGKAPPSYSE